MNETLADNTRAGSQHMYSVEEDIVTGAHKVVHVTWMSLYADGSLAEPVELLEDFATLKIQGEFQWEAIQAVAISADNVTEWIVQVEWAGLHELEMT